MATVAELVARLDADTSALRSELRRADKGMDDFERKGKRSAKTVSSSFVSVKTAMIGVSAVITGRLLGGMVSTITQFEKLEASLKTVTGSSEAASIAFDKIQNFAATTPFQLEEVVGAFIKLKALGLDPSEAALESYGNTASAMGKSLNQMIEAVADASTGEFERLKEFGIKARSEGDNVSFTFQGVTTTIGKNAEEIEGYLRSIGNVQFAGAMAEQSDTLNVSLSNLGDEISKLIVDIGEAGLTGAMKTAVDTMKGLVQTSRDLVQQFREGRLVQAKEEFGQLTDRIIYLTEAAQKMREQIAANETGWFDEFMGRDPESMQDHLDRLLAQLERLREQRNAMREEIMGDEVDILGMPKEAPKEEKASPLEKKIEEEKNLYNQLIRNTQGFLKIQQRLRREDYKSDEEYRKAQGQLFRSAITESANSNKLMFNINKAARLSEAVLGAYGTIATAYDWGVRVSGGNPVAGAAAAAVAATAKASQIASIASAQYGGGGGGASSTGGGGAIPVTPVDSLGQGVPTDVSGAGNLPASNISIVINSATGDVPEESIRELVARIKEVQDDNVRG